VALRKVYFDKLNFTSGWNVSSNSKILSTFYGRTIHSAIAFAYGFLPNFEIGKVGSRFVFVLFIKVLTRISAQILGFSYLIN